MKIFLLRFVRPALYFPVRFFKFFPGDPRQGLKRGILKVVCYLDKPILKFLVPGAKT